MRKIILTSLFFCLAITTVLAQITPDGTTTSTSDVSGVTVISIAAPDSNGLSNNTYSDFDISSSGVILNNSASASASQLTGGNINGNSNITAGSEAILILNQVTSNNDSLLEGTTEVVGTRAGVIIANPNGIDCDGCGFINTNRVDLVTGTANFSGDDLTGFSIDDAAMFFVRNTGFVSDAVADELNLISHDLRIQAQAKANNTLRLLAGNDTYDHTTNIITSDDTEVSAHSIQINASGILEANYIELISTEISSSHGIVTAGGDISADRLKLDSNGLFRNQDDGGGVIGDINISGLLEVITADRFINNGNITADTLTITTDEFFNNHNGGTQLGKIFVTDTFSLSTPSASYTNTGSVISDSLNLITSGDFVYKNATLSRFTFNNLAITTAADYTQGVGVAIYIAGDLSIQVNGEASLDAASSIQARNLFFSANDLWNQADITITENATFDFEEYFRNGFFLGGVTDGGDIQAVSFNATVGKDFLQRYTTATISADNFNVTAGGIFRNRGSEIYANSFDVTAKTSFENEDSSIINVENFNVTTGTYFENDSNSEISAVSFNVTSERDFENDNSTINVDNFNVTSGNIFRNIDGAIINADSFNVTAGEDFVNTSSSTIAADTVTIEVANFDDDIDNTATVSSDSLNFILTADFTYNSTTLNGFDNFSNLGVSTDGSFTNNATINPTGSLTITANTFINTGGVVNVDTFNLSINNDFDYVTGYRSNGTITDSALNLNVAGNFSYDNVNDFIWAASDSLTVAGNANIDARTGDYIQSGGTVDVAGALTVLASDFDLQNGSTINVGGTLSVSTTNSFTPRSGATISVDTFDFSASILQNQATFTANDGTINIGGTNTQFLNNLGGEFNINNSLDIITAGEFSNYGDISAGDTLTITLTDTAESFFNGSGTNGNISANIFNLSVAGDFDYEDDYLNNGTITTNSFNLQVGGNFSYDDSASDFIWGANENLTVLGNADITVNNYTQNGAIDVTDALTINANSYTYNSLSDDFTWNANDSLSVTGNADITTNNYTQNGAIDVAGALAISAVGDFTNLTAGSINAATLAITVGEGTIDNDGTITTTSLTIDTDRIHNSGSITATTSLTINATNDVFSGGSIETSALAIDAGRNFGISGSITSDSLNITAGYTALNTGTIVSGSLDITTDDFFRNLAGGDISVDSLNITAGGKVTNIATITVGTLNIIANNDSSRTDDTTDFYVSNRGDITVTNLINITAVDNFYNTGNLTADTLAITAKDILLLNTDSIEPYDGGDIVLSGDSSFIADGGDGVDGGIVVNRGNIDLGVFNLDITANRFINHVGANVTADTLNLDVSSFVQNGFIDATIDQ